MRKFNILFALFCILTLASCESFLDKEPTNNSSETDDVHTLMNGIYTKMCSSSYLGRNMFLYSDAKGGDLTIYSQGRGSDALYTFNHDFNSGSYSGFWSHGYNMILQINNVLANIDRMIEEEKVTADEMEDYIGQALTMRGMIYFDLVRLYGQPYNMNKEAWGVPDIAEVITSDAQPLRDKVSKNYERIVSDLTEGAAMLSEDKNNGKINYYANKAIQARVYLHMENWSAALSAAKEIINSGKYDLYTPAKWVDSWTLQYGSESIFELEMNVEDNDLGGSSLGVYYARQADYGTNLGYFGASDYFLARLGEDPTDVRWGIMTYDERSNSFDDSYATDRLGCCYKYLGSVDQAGDGKAQASAVNIKVVRLSEIYLIAAEAALKSNDASAAADYLNEIRKRAPGLAPATAATVSEDMILDERSKELYGEGHRFWDMIRCNKQIKFDDETAGINPPTRANVIDRTFFRCILPISESEMNVNPGIVAQQNPGYGTI